jgi:methionyl-tRNA formyltransferase
MTKVLILGPHELTLKRTLGRQIGLATVERIAEGFITDHEIDLVISYGYRFILPQEVIDEVQGNAVNLHISLLPWNKGADPNFWSWYEGTPKGVSIHWMTAGLDEGQLISQQEMELSPELTLKESYETLGESIVNLFEKNVDSILEKRAPKTNQNSGGTHHKSNDRLKLWDLFPLGWNTPCREVSAIGRSNREANS